MSTKSKIFSHLFCKSLQVKVQVQATKSVSSEVYFSLLKVEIDFVILTGRISQTACIVQRCEIPARNSSHPNDFYIEKDFIL